jgi:hypothetical protein
MNRLLNFYAVDTIVQIEDSLSFSCNKDFVDIDQAKEHSRSLCHEVTEETQRAGKDDQLFLA